MLGKGSTKKRDRLFHTARAIDCTGTGEIKMQEKVAAALAGVSDKETFVDLAAIGALSVPVLCSHRMAIRKRVRKPDKDERTQRHESAGEDLDAVIVEAVECKTQYLHVLCPTRPWIFCYSCCSHSRQIHIE